jgi:hypothetical protein
MFWACSIPIAVVLVVLAALAARRVRMRRPVGPQASPLVQAKRRFHAQRERLEAKFLQLTTAHSNPDAPRWADCIFADDVAYVRSRKTGELSAFVAVTLATEDYESTPRPASENLQEATAVFRFDNDHWETDGKTILNLTPGEAVHYFRDDLEIVSEELAHKA